MTFDSSYHSDYKSHTNKKPTKVTRSDYEKRTSEHIPMFTETQTMSDYKYDPKEFRSVWVPKKVGNYFSLIWTLSSDLFSSTRFTVPRIFSTRT